MADPIYFYDGRLYGFRIGEFIWSPQGEKLARIFASEIYDGSGKYAGDLVDNRVCRSPRKAYWTRHGFTPFHRNMPLHRYQRLSKKPLPQSYKDAQSHADDKSNM